MPSARPSWSARLSVLLAAGVVGLLVAACSGAGSGSGSEVSSATSSVPPSPPAMSLEVVSTEFTVPRQVATAPGGELLVADQTGTIKVLDDGGKVRAEPVLDLVGTVLPPDGQRLENGLNGFVLAPDFATTGRFYTWATQPKRPKDGAGIRRVDTLTRWTADPAKLTADRSSAEVLLEVPQDHPDHAGALEFGADGMLYVGVGAASGDATAQDPKTLPGTVLRLDVSPAKGYATPPDNPFDGTTGRKEVWSYGQRNPFRLHADEALGVLVSEPMFRERDQQVGVASKGGNAGYPVLSAKARTCWTDGELAAGCSSANGIPGFTPPVLEYGPGVGQIVSGAVTTSSAAVPGLRDKVLVSDWEGAFLLAQPGEAPWRAEPVRLPLPKEVGAASTVWAMDVDANGVVHVLTTDGTGRSGAVLRLRG